ncbi:MAG TPA: nucleotidyltransferase family protein [Gammaproteobacteria bacterium]|jgi:D-glycero-alpha-D-manno-heptose 1-phosphate guanylyltransferase|nr:nucleotidyltransferase family protein [Gammaproteobacteria bacterium]
MKAIILVGGKGTRLRSVISDLPKPMAPIGNKPFLAHLLHYLAQQGMTHVVFSAHYLWEKIQTYFQSQYAGITIEYAIEDEPLGTGGAIVHALSLFKDKNPVFVLNGDTLVKLDYQAMYRQHQLQAVGQPALTLALRSVADCQRYGNVVLEKQRVIQFQEKGKIGPGLISAGVYLLNAAVFAAGTWSLPKQFSFETDFLLTQLAALQPYAFMTDDYFIDIGIPEDYARAQVELG